MGLIEDGEKYLVQNYGRLKVAFTEGKGARLWDQTGKEYLDFLAGIAVTNLGHSHPKVAEAVAAQALKLVHTSNLYYIGPQVELARWLVDHSFADRAFFCNSGTEANEAALKMARKWGAENKDGAFEIVAAEDSFHGRTMFSLAVTGQKKHQKGFAPLVPGVRIVPYGDAAAVEKALTAKTAAVIVEPIQGEGGVRVPPEGYLAALREICDREKVLLIYDEVQTGMGRTGRLFAYEEAGAPPDIMTLAKALGNGFPIGATLANEKAASALGPGSHASTFGGNFLACAAALAVVREFEEKDVPAMAREMGQYLRERLQEVAADLDCVQEVRGKGLLLGMALDRPGQPVVNDLFEDGVIINCTAETVLRFVPPLTITREEVDEMIPKLRVALEKLERS